MVPLALPNDLRDLQITISDYGGWAIPSSVQDFWLCTQRSFLVVLIWSVHVGCREPNQSLLHARKCLIYILLSLWSENTLFFLIIISFSSPLNSVSPSVLKSFLFVQEYSTINEYLTS